MYRFLIVGVACLIILALTTQPWAASQCSVYVQVHSVEQVALAGAMFSAELNVAEDTTMVGDTLILTSRAITHTDADGKAFLWLVPNAILDSSSTYTFRIETKQGPKHTIMQRFEGFVPDLDTIGLSQILLEFKR